jgi:hypothetical protein
MARPEPGFIVIGTPASEYVSINITDRNPDGWLTGTLTLSAGPWAGTCRVSFYLGELRRFGEKVEKLHRDLIGSARLKPMEPYLELELVGDGKGHVIVRGRAQDSLSSDGTFVAFELGLDQTELPSIASALRLADPN